MISVVHVTDATATHPDDLGPRFESFDKRFDGLTSVEIEIHDSCSKHQRVHESDVAKKSVPLQDLAKVATIFALARIFSSCVALLAETSVKLASTICHMKWSAERSKELLDEARLTSRSTPGRRNRRLSGLSITQRNPIARNGARSCGPSDRACRTVLNPSASKRRAVSLITVYEDTSVAEDEGRAIDEPSSPSVSRQEIRSFSS